MLDHVACTCGKKYKWKPNLAGKQARCSCGNHISFPSETPDAEIPMESVPTPLRNSKSNPVTSPATPSPVEEPPLLTKIGVFAAGLATLGYFAVWPIFQVMHEEPSIQISFKGILLGTMLTMIGLNLLILGSKGIPWKKTEDQPLTRSEERRVGKEC